MCCAQPRIASPGEPKPNRVVSAKKQLSSTTPSRAPAMAEANATIPAYIAIATDRIAPPPAGGTLPLYPRSPPSRSTAPVAGGRALGALSPPRERCSQNLPNRALPALDARGRTVVSLTTQAWPASRSPVTGVTDAAAVSLLTREGSGRVVALAAGGPRPRARPRHHPGAAGRAPAGAPPP